MSTLELRAIEVVLAILDELERCPRQPAISVASIITDTDALYNQARTWLVALKGGVA